MRGVKGHISAAISEILLSSWGKKKKKMNIPELAI
jgi:hypothetical protein